MDRSNYTGYLGFGKNSRPRLSSPGKNYSPFSGKKKYFSRKKSLFLPPFFESRKSIQEDLPGRGNKKGVFVKRKLHQGTLYNWPAGDELSFWARFLGWEINFSRRIAGKVSTASIIENKSKISEPYQPLWTFPWIAEAPGAILNTNFRNFRDFANF